MSTQTDTDTNTEARGFLSGIRVVEIADELGEYGGKVLAGLGADVIKVEPPGGEATRQYGPHLHGVVNPDRSLHFWHYNFGKRGIVLDLETEDGQADLRRLLSTADVLLETRPKGYFDQRRLAYEDLRAANPGLIHGRITPFGDDGPWAHFQASDLIHLALGGVVMNCGYDPEPDGVYDTPPVAPQMWQAYHMAGDHMAMGIVGALLHRLESGRGQQVSVAVHEVVSTNTETDIPDWVYQRRPHFRQTCRHSMPDVGLPALARTKDGRWLLPYRTYLPPSFGDPLQGTIRLLQRYGMELDLADDDRYTDPATRTTGMNVYIGAVTDMLIERFKFDADLWRIAQEEGMPWSPCRRPEENLDEEHWTHRETFFRVEHPELEETFDYVGAKWLASEVPWRRGPRAPLVGEHTVEVQAEALARKRSTTPVPHPSRNGSAPVSKRGKPFALTGLRVVDLSWLLASGGSGRFLAALGAEVIKVEHDSRVDAMRFGVAFAPPGGREEREGATTAIEIVDPTSLNRSGAFMEINAGKLGVSLNLKSDRGRELLTELLKEADVVIEGFSPGTMKRMGFGFDRLREINPRLVYVQQSGMGEVGTYGRLRSYGPTAAAITGLSEMSGLPEPFAPAGIGYSYLDWYGAYNMALAVLVGVYRQQTTGKGCWIDSSQAETGTYLTGTAVLNASANGERWRRYGNRSPYKPASPHGVYPASGTDRWIALGCFTEEQWRALHAVLWPGESETDSRFATLEDRIAHADALDNLVADATRSRDPFELMNALQDRGVPAGVCQTAEDRCDSDPQLAHLGWTVDLEQSEIGTWPVKEVGFKLSDTPPYVGGIHDRHGPSYAEDNAYVYGDILGLSEAEQEELRSDGVI